MTAYYNEIYPYCVQWLRNLIDEGLLPFGHVDDRRIQDVGLDDLRGYTQAHFFAGLGGWPHALRLAGWPDERPIWTGSCPCQPFSVAGKGLGTDDERHLWPDFLRLIRAGRPPVVMGEQVAGKAGYGWLDGVRADLAAEGYASRGVDIPACAVDAPHIRSRLYWIAVENANGVGLQVAGDGQGECGSGGDRSDDLPSGSGSPSGLALADALGSDALGYPDGPRPSFGQGQLSHDEAQRPPTLGTGRNGTFWSDAEWLVGADGKARRAQSGLRLLAHGVPARVAKLRALGNAIVPQLAAEVVGAWLDAEYVEHLRLSGGIFE